MVLISEQGEKKDIPGGSLGPLFRAFLYMIYNKKGELHHEEIAILRGKINNSLLCLSQDVFEKFKKGAISRDFLFHYKDIIRTNFSLIIQEFQTSAFEQILTVNLKSYPKISQENLTVLKNHIQNHLQKIIHLVENEIDILLEVFHKECMNIALESSNISKRMLELSHQRSLTRIDTLKKETQRLCDEIVVLGEKNQNLEAVNIQLSQENTSLQEDISQKETVIAEQSDKLTRIYHNWSTLNKENLTLKEQITKIEDYMTAIETVLKTKKRMLVGETLPDKMEGIFKVISKLQQDETAWQHGFVKQQKTDYELRQEKELTLQLQKRVSELTQTITDLHDEISDYQELQSNDLQTVLSLFHSMTSRYFKFLIESNGFINQQEANMHEENIKKVYYRLKMEAGQNIEQEAKTLMENLYRNYCANSTYGKQDVEFAYGELKKFINELLYGKNYATKAINRYQEVETL